MSFALEQFFAALHLRIITISNLEPGGSFPFRDVGSESVLGNNPLQIQLAHAMKQRRTVLLYVVGVSQP
jgi:hypothetical protein